MSWLGKILTFVVAIGAVVWAALTVNVYVARTNWKARADTYEKALAASEKNRIAEQRMWEGERAALTAQLAAERGRNDRLDEGYKTLDADRVALKNEFEKLRAPFREAGIREQVADAQRKATLTELDSVRKTNDALQDDRVNLVREREQAFRDRLKAEGDARVQQARADDNAKKVLELTDVVAQLRQTGGGGGTAAVLRTIDRAAPPVMDGTRGTVKSVSGNLVQINIGIDAGLEPGSRLDVYRLANGGQFLGTLVVTKSIQPKEAVAEFRPARGVPLTQLRSDELPRAGDLVGAP
ncbi:MAG: hypothetical protein K2V38_20840 [Gemmataceae bacterium]|nr:hypothetical protein [Gemmataceae bacterium]